jgi:hypothetical protein
VEDLTEDELGLINILEQAHAETFPLECNDDRYNLVSTSYRQVDALQTP